jgi:molybdopterin-guanine dinucleotide biosynthesis protein A
VFGSAVVLCGGGSTRFGSDKRYAILNGVPLWIHALRLANRIAEETVLVVSSISDMKVMGPYLSPQTTVEIDRSSEYGKSPIVGMLTGLAAVSSQGPCIVLPCDTPMVSPQFLLGLLRYSNLIPSDSSYDCVIPTWPNGRVEPLNALYYPNPTLKAIGDLPGFTGVSLRVLLRKLKVLEYALKGTSTERKMYYNINRTEDLSLIKKYTNDSFSFVNVANADNYGDQARQAL